MGIIEFFTKKKMKEEISLQKERIVSLEKERNELRKVMKEIGGLDLMEIKKEIDKIEESKSTKLQDIENCINNITALELEIKNRKNEIVELDEEILLQSFGLYKPRYEYLKTSEELRIKLDAIRDHQKNKVKEGTAASCATSWTVNNNLKEGERMVRDYQKLILRAFNNECDASITDIKFNNIESIEKKIKKAYEILNKLGSRMSINISSEYLELKLQELYLSHEYQIKKQEEKEEQKRIREQMREEAKLAREIEEQRQKIVKEEKHFNNAVVALDEQLKNAKSEEERKLIENERAAILEELGKIDAAKKEIDYREQNTRAGYVYIISNIGAFGESVFKIGMTRRLDPQERVDELGDASVPFNFDIHAMIFSDDAPTLENAIQKKFAATRLNLINLRREFFQAKLEDIEKVVKENFSKPVEFIKTPDAAQFRQSIEIRKLTFTN